MGASVCMVVCQWQSRWVQMSGANRADKEQCCAKAKIKSSGVMSSMFDRCKRFLLLFTAAEPEDLTMS